MTIHQNIFHQIFKKSVSVKISPIKISSYTVPLKGNIALALHSTARSSRIKRSILALNARSASEHRVVNHSRLVRVLSIVSRSSLGLMPTTSSGTSISIVSRSSRGLVHTSSITLVSFLARLEKWYLNSRQQQAWHAHSNIDI